MRNPFLSGGLLALRLLSFASAAQPLRAPRPVAAGAATAASRPTDYPLGPAPRYAASGHPGTCRLPDGSWHPAEIFGPDLPDRVRLRPESLTDYAVFWPGEVSSYVVRDDTFVTVPAFVQRQGHRLVPASFAQRLYRDDRYEVLQYRAFTPDDERAYQQPVVSNGPVAAASAVGSATPRGYTFFDFLLSLFVYPRASQKMLLRQGGQTLELPAKAGAYRVFMLGLLADDPALCARLRAGTLATRFEAPQLLAAYAAHRREALLRGGK